MQIIILKKKKKGFRSNKSRHCAYLIYSVKTRFFKRDMLSYEDNKVFLIVTAFPTKHLIYPIILSVKGSLFMRYPLPKVV